VSVCIHIPTTASVNARSFIIILTAMSHSGHGSQMLTNDGSSFMPIALTAAISDGCEQ